MSYSLKYPHAVQFYLTHSVYIICGTKTDKGSIAYEKSYSFFADFNETFT